MYKVNAFFAAFMLAQFTLVQAFSPGASCNTRSATSSTMALKMSSDDENFMRWARASRTASADDNVVELQRPLGLVLNQDDNGNVYVETVAPKGNAARTGKVS
jgi:hypothetical protein